MNWHRLSDRLRQVR